MNAKKYFGFPIQLEKNTGFSGCSMHISTSVMMIEVQEKCGDKETIYFSSTGSKALSFWSVEYINRILRRLFMNILRIKDIAD